MDKSSPLNIKRDEKLEKCQYPIVFRTSSIQNLTDGIEASWENQVYTLE